MALLPTSLELLNNSLDFADQLIQAIEAERNSQTIGIDER